MTAQSKKHKVAKKTFHRKPRLQKEEAVVDETISEPAQPTVISDTPSQSPQLSTSVTPPVASMNPSPVQPSPDVAQTPKVDEMNATTSPQSPVQTAPVIPNDESAKMPDVAVVSPVVESSGNNNQQQISQPTSPVIGEPVVSVSSSDSSSDSDSKPHKNFLLPMIFIVLLGIAVLGGVYFYMQNSDKTQKSKTNVVTLSPTPQAVTPEPEEVDLSKYSIEVLNGSGVSGTAGKVKDSLEDVGFSVESVGNADNSDYTKTIIQAKKEVDKVFLDELKKTLGKTYSVGDLEDLKNSSDTDVVVIIGSSEASE